MIYEGDTATASIAESVKSQTALRFVHPCTLWYGISEVTYRSAVCTPLQLLICTVTQSVKSHTALTHVVIIITPLYAVSSYFHHVIELTKSFK